jgi:hypothetical protein
MDTIVAEYGIPGQVDYRRVQIDLESGVVTFYRCHIPSRFLAFWPEPEYRCRIDDLRGLSWMRLRQVGDVWVVVTPAGRARLPEAMTGGPVLQTIQEAVRCSGRRLRWYEHPAAKIPLGIAAAAVGTFGGLGLFFSRVVPVWVFMTGLLAAVALVAAIPVVAWWRGHSLW